MSMPGTDNGEVFGGGAGWFRGRPLSHDEFKEIARRNLDSYRNAQADVKEPTK